MYKTLIGNSGHEHLYGSDSDDLILGNAGNDIVEGFAGNDALVGGSGHDALFGGIGVDQLNGGIGDDFLAPGTGSYGLTQVVLGDAGSDTLSFFDWNEGNKGVYVEMADGYAQGLTENSSSVEFDGIENVEGSMFRDWIYGDYQDNVLRGLSGDDELSGGGGADLINGGDGRDLATYRGSDFGVAVLLDQNYAAGGDASGDTLISIEDLEGSSHNDTLHGNNGANTLWGKDGLDVLSGLGGRDMLFGGMGADHLWGGTARDTFVYTQTSESPFVASDVVHDFQDAFIESVGGFLIQSRDIIDLQHIDANPYLAGNNAFTFVEGDFTGAGQLRVRQEGGNTFVQANTEGDGGIDLQIQLSGLHNLTADHFLL